MKKENDDLKRKNQKLDTDFKEAERKIRELINESRQCEEKKKELNTKVNDMKEKKQKLESDIKEKEMKIEELKEIKGKYERDLDGCINEKTCSEKAKKLQEEKNEWVELLFTILIISIVFNRQQTVPFILRIFFLILSPNTLNNNQTNTARNTSANQS